MVLGKLLVPGRPAHLNNSRQGPTVLAVGAGGSCLDFFFSKNHFPSFSLLLGDGPIRSDISKGR